MGDSAVHVLSAQIGALRLFFNEFREHCHEADTSLIGKQACFAIMASPKQPLSVLRTGAESWLGFKLLSCLIATKVVLNAKN